MLSSSRPARPANGSPARSSSASGASPTIIQSACRCPVPKTGRVRPAASAQRVQVAARRPTRAMSPGHRQCRHRQTLARQAGRSSRFGRNDRRPERPTHLVSAAASSSAGGATGRLRRGGATSGRPPQAGCPSLPASRAGVQSSASFDREAAPSTSRLITTACSRCRAPPGNSRGASPSQRKPSRAIRRRERGHCSSRTSSQSRRARGVGNHRADPSSSRRAWPWRWKSGATVMLSRCISRRRPSRRIAEQTAAVRPPQQPSQVAGGERIDEVAARPRKGIDRGLESHDGVDVGDRHRGADHGGRTPAWQPVRPARRSRGRPGSIRSSCTATRAARSAVVSATLSRR